MLHGTRTVLYARFSSDNQRSESIDAQVRAMTDQYIKGARKRMEYHITIEETVSKEFVVKASTLQEALKIVIHNCLPLYLMRAEVESDLP